MKRLTKVLFSIFIVCLLFACPFFISKSNTEPQVAYSKDYIDYLNAEDKSSYGDTIPELYELESYSIEPASSIPSYYCLRDDMMIYTTYQGSYGLCWAYTCNIALETMIAKNYGEFYNFSSAWVGLTTKYYWDNNNYSSYTIGGGGNMSYYKYAVENYGLMLEADFDLKDFHSVDDKNYKEIYNKYSSKTIESLGLDFDYVTYASYPSKETIKSHILSNGALYAGIKSGDIVNQTSLCSLVGSNSDHAVSIIGWDDSYKASSWSSSGAWIALNSWGDDWGNNGIFYISYNDVIANEEMFGFIPKDLENNKVLVEISSSSTSIDNLIVNKYTSTKNTTTSTFANGLNVFEEGEEVNVEYSYLNANNLKEIELNISKNEQIVNNLFTNNTIDYTQQIIYLNADELSNGTYELEMKFIFNDNSSQVINKSIVVLDGLELDSVYYSSDLINDYKTTNQIATHFANYNSFNQDDLFFELYANKYCYLRFYLPVYSKIASYSYTTTSGMNCIKADANFSKFGNNYSKGYIYFSLNISDSISPVSIATFTFTNDKGSTKTYTFTVHNQNYYSSNMTYTYTTVDYNGADGNMSVPADLAIATGEKKYIDSPTRGYSSFDGWYTDPNFSENSKLPIDSKGYYITSSLVSTNTGTNYMLKNFNKDNNITAHFNYIYLYAKWIDIKYSITYNWTDINGEKQSQVVEVDISNSSAVDLIEVNTLSQPGYEFVWESGYTNIDYEKGIINNLNQNIKITGKYIPKTPTVTSFKIGNEQTSNLNTTYSQKNSYTMLISASHEAENVNFIYTWKKKDEIGIYKKVSGANTNALTVNKASHSGEYICEVVAKNNTLLSSSKPAVSTKFVITINKAQTIINTTNIITEYTYNGEYHEINGATINHNELSDTQLTYINNTFKDVGTGTKKVTIVSRETENYTSAVETILIKVNKAKITIKIDNKRGAVFAEKQPFTYTKKFGEIYGKDDLQLEYKSNASIYLAGEYEITAEAKNTNYEVEIINGTYSVYIEGLSLVLIIAGMIILVALICLLVYFIIRKRANDKFLNSNDFDDDIRF